MVADGEGLNRRVPALVLCRFRDVFAAHLCGDRFLEQDGTGFRKGHPALPGPVVHEVVNADL